MLDIENLRPGIKPKSISHLLGYPQNDKKIYLFLISRYEEKCTIASVHKIYRRSLLGNGETKNTLQPEWLFKIKKQETDILKERERHSLQARSSDNPSSTKAR